MTEDSEKTVNGSLVAAMSVHGTVSPVDKNVINVYTIALPYSTFSTTYAKHNGDQEYYKTSYYRIARNCNFENPIDLKNT